LAIFFSFFAPSLLHSLSLSLSLSLSFSLSLPPSLSLSFPDAPASASRVLVLPSVVSVICDQPWSKNIKWKVPEIILKL
jgi:hypothetical protein